MAILGFKSGSLCGVWCHELTNCLQLDSLKQPRLYQVLQK